MWWMFMSISALIYCSTAFGHPQPSLQGEQIFITNGDITIHYRKYGSGPYLVMQHGFPDHEATFNDFQIPLFAQSYTVLTPTLRGYPPSSVPPNASDYSADHFVSDLLVILANEKAEQVTLLGHDVGGAVVQYFALQHPDRVNALIILNAPVIPVFLPLINFDKEEQDYARYTIPYYTYQPNQPKNISTLVAPIRNVTYRSQIAAYLEESPIDGMLHFYNENYPGPPYGQNVSLDGLVQKVPTLLLWGEEDPYFSPKLLDGLEGWFERGVRLVTVPGAGHWVFRDEWERTNREIVGFLGLVGEV